MTGMSMLPSATPLRRLSAFGVDYLLIVAYGAAIGLVSGVAARRGVPVERGFEDPVTAQAVAFLALTLPVGLYFAICEASAWQGTIGKRMAGLRVVNATGRRLSVPRSLVRTGLKLVPWELSHTLLWRIEGWPTPTAQPGLGVWVGFGIVWIIVLANFLLIFRKPARRTVYDRIAGSLVADARGTG